MKACVLEDVGKLVYQDVPTPQPAPGEVLLAIRACGICSSDIDRVFKTGTYHFPTIPGHEFAGEVVALGEGVDSTWLGKRAAVFPLLPCRECPSCREQRYAHCSHYSYFGSRQDGAFAQYLAVPVWNLVPFDDTVSFSAAALCEPTAVALHAVKRSDIAPGSTVAVIGSGTIGIIIALRALSQGASRVFVVATRPQKVAFLKELGLKDALDGSQVDAPQALHEATDGLGPDVVFECVGSDASLEEALLACRKGGTVTVVGNPHGDMHIERNAYWKILRNELTLKGVWNSSYTQDENDWADALAFMAEPGIDLARLITHTYDLADYAQAFDTVRDRNEFSVKVMLNNDQ